MSRTAKALERIAEQSEARDSTADLYSALEQIADALGRIADALESEQENPALEELRAINADMARRLLQEAPPF